MLPSVLTALLGRSSSSSILITVPYSTSSLSSVVSKDTISYLTGVWGLPPEQANSAAKYMKDESTERADSVFNLLKSCGFRKNDVVKLISKQPGYVAADVEKDLRPKIEYMISLGISGSSFPSILCTNKGILSNNLKEIVPLFDFFKQFFKCNEDLAFAMKRSGRMIHGSNSSIKRCVVPNISTLQAHGVPYNIIARLIMWKPAALRLNLHSFEKVVREVEEMGFKPGKVSFVLGVDSLSGLSKEHWQSKRELFAKSGWSEEDFVSAFRKQPLIMLVSESKIMEVMDFLLNSVGLLPSETARYVNLFLLSLKKRMMPRCSVLQVLMENGKFKKQTATICTSLVIPSSKFVQKYVTVFEKDVPDVVKAYQGQLEFKGFTDDSERLVNSGRRELGKYKRGGS